MTGLPVLCRLSQQLAALTEDAERMPAKQEGGGEDMSGLVDGIMHQLLAKDVLYQPIQEIDSRYPQWLQEHQVRHSCFSCTCVPSSANCVAFIVVTTLMNCCVTFVTFINC